MLSRISLHDNQSLLLAMIAGSDAISHDHIAQIPSNDWHEIVETALYQRIAPLLFHHAKMQGWLDSIPDNLRQKLSNKFQSSTIRAFKIHNTLSQIESVLTASGIPWLALKGAWLAWQVYPNPALRPMRDIDILVAPQNVMQAYNILLAHGFIIPDDATITAEQAVGKKHLPAITDASTGISIEIHQRLLTDISPAHSMNGLNDFNYLHHGASMMDLAGKKIPIPSAEVSLLHMIVHATDEHLFDNGPLLLTDVSSILMNCTIDWPKFWQLAENGGWTRGCQIVFAMVSQYHPITVQMPSEKSNPIVEPALLQDIASMMLQSIDPIGVGFEAGFLSDKGFSEKMARIKSTFFPPRYIIEEYARINPGDWRVYGYYVLRIADLGRIWIQHRLNTDFKNRVAREARVAKWLHTVT